MTTRKNPRLTRLHALCLAAATTAALSACGGSGGDTDITPAPTPAPAPSPSPGPAPSPSPAPGGKAPVARDDTAVMRPGQAVSINVLANDTDADGDLDPGSVRFVDPPRTFGLSADGRTLTAPGQGVWTVNSQGVVTFTPAAGFTGQPTEVEYTVRDRAGHVSESADIRITVQGSTGAGTLAACLNEAMFRQGSTYAVTTRDLLTGNQGTLRYRVVGPASFRGHNAVHTEVRSTDGGVSHTYTALTHEAEEVYGGSYTLAGGHSDTFHYSPPMRTPVSLRVGQSHLEKTTLTYVSGASTTHTRTVTLEGFETVAVPAGTFQVCRISNTYAESGGKVVAYVVASGPYRGLSVKQMSYGPGGALQSNTEATALSADWK